MSSDEIRMTKDVFTWVFTTFVETIHVKLSNEGVYISVSEIFRENVVLKVIYLFDGEFFSIGHPVYDTFVFFVFKYLKAFLDEVCY